MTGSVKLSDAGPDSLLYTLIDLEARLKERLGEDPSVEDSIEHQRVVELIAALPAKTLEGLRRKAVHALTEWTGSGGPRGEIFNQACSLIVELVNVAALLTDEEFSERRVRQ